MDARSDPSLNDPFEEAIDDALRSLPAKLRAALSNVEIVVEDEPPDGQPLLGLYRGIPLPRRSSMYAPPAALTEASRARIVAARKQIHQVLADRAAD